MEMISYQSSIDCKYFTELAFNVRPNAQLVINCRTLVHLNGENFERFKQMQGLNNGCRDTKIAAINIGNTLCMGWLKRAKR
jgi:hypothetical protein